MDTRPAGRERSRITSRAEGSRAVKKTKTKACSTSFLGCTGDEDEANDDEDDKLQILDNAAVLARAPNTSASRPTHAARPADAVHKHTPQALANSSGPAERASQGVAGKDKQQAEKLSKMWIELEEAEVRVLKRKIEHEVEFGGDFNV
jgi:hypothetical protein